MKTFKVIMTFLFLFGLNGCDYFKGTKSSAGKTPNEIGGLVGYWKFDGNTGDSSGNGNDGKWVGNEGYGQGVSGKAADFDGSSFVTVPHSASIDVGKDAFSYGAWINSYGKGNKNQHFLDKRTVQGEGLFWDMYLSPSAQNVNAEFARRSMGNPQTTMETYKWHHIMFTRDSSDLATIYVDGFPLKSETLRGDSSNTFAFSIGGLEEDLSQGFNGLIDEVVIYNRGLNEEEVISLYEGGRKALGH